MIWIAVIALFGFVCACFLVIADTHIKFRKRIGALESACAILENKIGMLK